LDAASLSFPDQCILSRKVAAEASNKRLCSPIKIFSKLRLQNEAEYPQIKLQIKSKFISLQMRLSCFVTVSPQAWLTSLAGTYLMFAPFMQFKFIKYQHNSSFLSGDGVKKEHRQWAGPKRRKPAKQDAQQEAAQVENASIDGSGVVDQDQPGQLLGRRRARAWTSGRV
jgi:hypothetical protein